MKKFKRLAMMLMILTLAAAVFVGCAQKSETPGPETPGPETPAQYTVTLEYGIFPREQSVTDRIQTMPQKEHKDFTLVGWYTEPTCSDGSRVKFPYRVERNVTLYAKWDPKKPVVVSETYTMKELVIKNDVVDDLYYQIDRLSAEEQALLESTILLYGRSVVIHGNSSITFRGSAFAAYNPVSFTLAGNDVKFAEQDFAGYRATLAGGVFTIAVGDEALGTAVTFVADSNRTWAPTVKKLRFTRTGEAMQYYEVGANLPAEQMTGRIEIPTEYKGLPVTEIRKQGFYGCERLESVVIPESVVRVEASAFANCASLNKIDFLPRTEIIHIEDYAFANCVALKSVALPGYNAWNRPAFNLGDYQRAGNAYTIYCADDSSPYVSGGNTIYSQVYNYYKNVDPAQIDLVSGDYRYAVSDGKAVLLEYSGSESCVRIPDRIEGIPVFAINGECFTKKADVITELQIPDSVTKIGNYAFSGLKLTSLRIPDSVTEIGYAALWECNRLAELELPFVGNKASNTYAYDETHVFGNIFGKWNTYSSNDKTSQRFDEYDSSINGVPQPNTYSFNIPRSIKTLRLTDVRKLFYGALANCSFLETIYLSAGLENVGGAVFLNCKATVYFYGDKPFGNFEEKDCTFVYNYGG